MQPVTRFFSGGKGRFVVLGLLVLVAGMGIRRYALQKPAADGQPQVVVAATVSQPAPAEPPASAPLPAEVPTTPVAAASAPADPAMVPAPDAPVPSRLEAFAPLLDGRGHAVFRDLRLSALASGSGGSGGLAVINGRVLREGDMLGLSRLVYVGADALVMQFNNRHYVLYPKREQEKRR